MTRPRLSSSDVERIRRERYAPRPTQCDYLHLAALGRAIQRALSTLREDRRPALDLYCGTQPYRRFIPRSEVWGVDRDLHFGAADVVADGRLPFADGAFTLATCTQALHLVDDPPAAVRELARVLAPGGVAIITVPHVFIREIPSERKLSRDALDALFRGWELRIEGVGGLGGAVAFCLGSVVIRASRHWRWLTPLMPVAGLLLTAFGTIFDAALAPLARRVPGNWLIVARRPAG